MNEEEKQQKEALMQALFGEQWEKAKEMGVPTLDEIKGRVASLLLAIAMWGDKPPNLKMVGDMAMGALEGVIGVFDELQKQSDRISFLESLLSGANTLDEE